MLETKLSELAQMMDGQVIAHPTRGEVCVKGIISGFPITLEAIKATYPFGVSYFLETGFMNEQVIPHKFKLTITPRYMNGWLSLVSRILFFESRGQKVHHPQLDSALRFKFDNVDVVKSFVQYPEVAEKILQLEKYSHFNEMLINSGAGLYLSQPVNFLSLDLNLCKEIFNVMAGLGQVLFEAF
jgi:hypothetical protein